MTYSRPVHPSNRHNHCHRHRAICLGCSDRCCDNGTDRDDMLHSQKIHYEAIIVTIRYKKLSYRKHTVRLLHHIDIAVNK